MLAPLHGVEIASFTAQNTCELMIGKPGRELPAPTWLRRVDDVVLLVVNLALVGEVSVVFINTALRATTNGTIIQGMEELSRLFLIVTAFAAGGVAYGRGRFMAITAAVERLP